MDQLLFTETVPDSLEKAAPGMLKAIQRALYYLGHEDGDYKANEWNVRDACLILQAAISSCNPQPKQNEKK